MDSPIGPEGSSRFPQRAQALIVRHRVLDDERLDPVRISQRHPKTHGAAIVLHVKRIARKPECFGEALHDLGAVVEGIGEFGSGQSLCPKPG
jgi:hypothetical protein